MALIKWRDSYSVGVEQFDRQHEKLVELINEIFMVVRNKEDISSLNKAMETLVTYTRTHFVDEEAAMEQAGFPQLEEHRREHEALTRQVSEYCERIEAEPDYSQVLDCYGFLRNWLLDHILQSDSAYGEYMAKNIG